MKFSALRSKKDHAEVQSSMETYQEPLVGSPGLLTAGCRNEPAFARGPATTPHPLNFQMAPHRPRSSPPSATAEVRADHEGRSYSR